MDTKTYASNLSEAKVTADLCHKGYHIFSQTSGKAPFDLTICKDDAAVKRVQVKACNQRTKNNKYQVQLKTVHTSMKENRIVKFDSSKCDMLAIYFIDIDKVVYLNSNDVHDQNSVALSTDDSRYISP
jgi:hypothetical protein